MSLKIKFTDIGLSALVNPDNIGTSALDITHIEVGGAHYDPDGSETSLKEAIKSLATFGGEVVAADTIHVTLRDDSSDTYNVGEIGLRTGNGSLLGIISSNDTDVITQKGPNDVLLISVDAAVTGVDVSNLTFGSTEFIYSPASTVKKGIVKLSSQLTSDSEVDAATSKAVKTLKGYIDSINVLLRSDKTSLDTLQEIVDFIELNRSDLDGLTITAVAGLQSALNAKANTSHSHTVGDLPSATTSAKGAVQLTTSTSSSSTVLAPTASALKSVMDVLNKVASKASTTSLSNITNSYNREVTASGSSGASGTRSQVNTSYQSSASGQNTQVNSSYYCEATWYNSQVNASSFSKALGSNSQINCSTGTLSNTSIAEGQRSQINGSVLCFTGKDAHSSQINGSLNCNVSGFESQINSSGDSSISGSNSTISSSWYCNQEGHRSTIIASQGVSVPTSELFNLSMGYGSGTSTANRTILLDSRSGAGRFNGNTFNSGADYAEYFENYEKGVIPDGSIITLVDKDTVRLAKTGDKILGVLSTSPSVTGNAPHSAWPERYLKNDFGRLLTESVAWVSFRNEEGAGYDGPLSRCEVEIPDDAKYFEQNEYIENPDYNPEGDYCERWDRPEEWSVVGLLGQLMVRVYENINTEFVSADGHSSTEPTRLELMFMHAPFDSEKGYAVAKCLLR